MGITNTESGTRVDEIADGIYRISTPTSLIPGGFTFNQFLVEDEAPLLFHTGLRGLFPVVREAVAHVLGDAGRLRYVSFSHWEADESGALGEWLTTAPNAVPLSGKIGAMVSASDATDRTPRGLADGEQLELGGQRVVWFDAPHVPHGWDCGFLGELTTKTLFCGDLFTQAGAEHPPSRKASSWDRAKACGRRWTTTPIPPTRAATSSASRRSNRARSLACTAPPSQGTAAASCSGSSRRAAPEPRLRRAAPARLLPGRRQSFSTCLSLMTGRNVNEHAAVCESDSSRSKSTTRFSFELSATSSALNG